MSDNPYNAPTAEPPLQQPPEKDEMTAVDWVLCVICPGIACIIGIIRLVQGKKHAGMMIAIAIGFAVLWNVIGFILGAVGGVAAGPR